jgi:hypothetical protein
MTFRMAFIAAAWCFPLLSCAQETSVPPLNSEPHHHLAWHNDYVNVYSVEVPPHDSVQLHKHEADAVSIMLSNSEITVHVPGKPPSHQAVTHGQLRLQPAGYVHSTSIDGNTPYRNITVELLMRQDSPRNLCAAVIAVQPTNCPESPTQTNALRGTERPQFQTDQTNVTLIRISSGQRASLDVSAFPRLFVMLDDIETSSGNTSGKVFHAGDFLWRDANSPAPVFDPVSPGEGRVLMFSFKNEKPAK